MRFGDLRTGDIVTLCGSQSLVLAIQRPHPQNPAFLLIVWYLFDEKAISADMLHPDYALITGTSVHSDGMLTWTRVTNDLRNAR